IDVGIHEKAVPTASVDGTISGTVFILKIGPCRLVDPTSGHTGIDGHGRFLAYTGTRLCGNDHRSIGGTGSVQSRCGRSFEHVDGFDVVRVDVRGHVSIIKAPSTILLVGRVEIGVAQGHPVLYEKGLVVPGQGSTSTDHHVGGSPQVGPPFDLYPGNLSGKCIDHVVRGGSVHVLPLNFLGGISK